VPSVSWSIFDGLGIQEVAGNDVFGFPPVMSLSSTARLDESRRRQLTAKAQTNQPRRLTDKREFIMVLDPRSGHHGFPRPNIDLSVCPKN
jgi:hypothetical protein